MTPQRFRKTVLVKAGRVRLLILDVDGVLTDGKVYLTPSGGEIKVFHVHDGSALVRAREAGLIVALVSGRRSPAVIRRARELGIPEVFQGVKDKAEIFERLSRKYNVVPAEVAYVGDEAGDLPLLESAGFSGTVEGSHPELAGRVDYRSRRRGGEGAVMEIIELILRARKRAAQSEPSRDS